MLLIQTRLSFTVFVFVLRSTFSEFVFFLPTYPSPWIFAWMYAAFSGQSTPCGHWSWQIRSWTCMRAGFVCACVWIDACVLVVQLGRCIHNAFVYARIRHVIATSTHTQKNLSFSHTACVALKTVIPILDKNPRCPSPGLLPPPFEMPLHPYNWS